MLKPHFEDFSYQGADNQTAIDTVISNRRYIYAPTGESSEDGEQELATFLATPTHIDGQEVLVRMTEFADENGRPSGALFDSLIAESTGRRVISTNLPGIDFYGDSSHQQTQKLTSEQKTDLREGSFNKVGRAVMSAVHSATLAFDINPQYIILGTSMSSAIAASALSVIQEKELDIRGVTFNEPINILRRPILALGKQFIATNRTAAGYVAMNPDSVRNASEPVLTIAKRALRTTNFLYAMALANGTFSSDIQPLSQLTGIPVFMSRGANSTISPEYEFGLLHDFLKTTADVQTTTYGDHEQNPHDHAYVLTVQSFIDAAANILNRIT